MAEASARCTACGNGLRQFQRFCSRCGSPAVWDAPPSELPSSTPQRPVELADDRRLVTVLVANLGPSTAYGDQLDPEALHFVVTSFFGTIARLVQRYGGTLGKLSHDGVMAYFGAPIAHEDDAERAVSAAFDIEAAVAHLNAELWEHHRVHLLPRVGIDTGEVVAGPLALEAQSGYSVVGAVVDAARAHADAALPGQILLGELTYGLVEHAFVAEPLAGLRMFHLHARRADELQRKLSPMIGRQRELEYLRGALDHARKGDGLAITIFGEPGVGKSRLVREFLDQRAAEVGQVAARSASFDSNAPYALIAALLRAAFHIRPGDAESGARSAIVDALNALNHEPPEPHIVLLLNVLGYGSQFPFNPESRRPILFSILRLLVDRGSEHAPLVIVAEDLQWADSASTAVLTDLARELPKRACLFVVTARPEWTPPWPCERLELQPLGSTDVRALIAQLIGHAPDDALTEAILKRAEGNPLFVEEVARDVARGTSHSVPLTVQKVIQARLDRLPPGPRNALQCAAVCGTTISHRVLERLTPRETLFDDVALLAQQGLLVPSSAGRERSYAFRHALIQEVAYQGQLKSRRRVRHAQVAAAIEALYANRLDEFLSELALHYSRSDRDDKALYWLVRAADRARGLYANVEALSLYQAALSRTVDGAAPLEAGTLLERIGEVHSLVGEYDLAVGSFRAALERMGDVPNTAVARLWRKIGTAMLWQGSYAKAAQAFDRGLAVLGQGDQIEAARIQVQIGSLQFRRGDHAAARAGLSRVLDTTAILGADDVAAEALKHLGNVAVHTGDLKSAAAYNEQSREIYERLEDVLGLADSHANLGIIHRRTGQWQRAMAEYEVALKLRERAGDLRGVVICHNNIAEVHRTLGDAEQAIPAYTRAFEMSQSFGSALLSGVALVGLGASRIELGDITQGRANLLDAEGRFAGLGSTLYLPDLYRYLAAAEVADGNLEAAQEAVVRSLSYAQAAGAHDQIAMTQRVEAQVAAARGDLVRARELLDASRRTLREVGDVGELARTEAVLDTLART
ncbi:MAG TPA: tetratricopeptide repeat protein [Chloroflexota bacterium]